MFAERNSLQSAPDSDFILDLAVCHTVEFAPNRINKMPRGISVTWIRTTRKQIMVEAKQSLQQLFCFARRGRAVRIGWASLRGFAGLGGEGDWFHRRSGCAGGCEADHRQGEPGALW